MTELSVTPTQRIQDEIESRLASDYLPRVDRYVAESAPRDRAT